MTEFVTVSWNLDRALMMEEYHRDQLLYWRQRRYELEQQISNPIDELSQIAEDAFNATNNAVDQD